MRFAFTAFVLAASSVLCHAQITTLSATLNVDNAFELYLSTSETTLGTQFLSGSSWPTTYSGSVGIHTAGTYYMHIRAVDLGLPAMVIGQFNLTGSDAQFSSTGTQSMLSSVSNFTASMGANPGATPATIFDVGPNGTGPWGTFAAIDSAARFVWARDGSNNSITGSGNPAYFTTRIEVVPEPASLALLGLGLAAVARRRRG